MWKCHIKGLLRAIEATGSELSPKSRHFHFSPLNSQVSALRPKGQQCVFLAHPPQAAESQPHLGHPELKDHIPFQKPGSQSLSGYPTGLLHIYTS